MQQHGVVKKPPVSSSVTPSVLISPSLHLLLIHFQISISHFRLVSPGFLYLPFFPPVLSVSPAMRNTAFLYQRCFNMFKKRLNVQVQSVRQPLILYRLYRPLYAHTHTHTHTLPHPHTQKYRCILSKPIHAG